MKNVFFVSYRRADSAQAAGRLAEALRRKAGRDGVFVDVHDLQAGQNWRAGIEDAITSSSVFFVLIGPRFGSLFKRSFLSFSKDDVLRFEVATALARSKVVVVPLVLDSAKVPGKGKLPEDVQPLLALHAYPLREASFQADLDAVLRSVGQAHPTVRWGVSGAATLAILKKYCIALSGRIETKKGEIIRDLKEQRGQFDPEAQARALMEAINVNSLHCVEELNQMQERLAPLTDAERRFVFQLFASLGEVDDGLSRAVAHANEGSGWKLAAKAFGLGVMGAGTGVVAGTAVPVIGNVVGGVVGFFGGLWAAFKEMSDETTDEIRNDIVSRLEGIGREVAAFAESSSLSEAADKLASGQVQ